MGLTKTAVFEFAEEGIRINAVNPGVILTGLPDPGSKFVAVLIDVTPMGRTAQLEEVGDVVVRLCSEEASFITGVPLPIDGGSLNGRA